MKFLVIGLGSMGKRRVRNLKSLGFDQITGFDPREDRRAEATDKYAITTIGNWDEARALQVDGWIVSTPPDTHLAYGFQAIERGIAFFTEANVPEARHDEMIRRLAETGIVGCPSNTMRYYPGPKGIRRLVEEGRIGIPRLLTYHTGQWLPDWHPWESYKDFYVSRRDTGACREIVPFELAWITAIFGDIGTINCMRAKITDLDCDIDDAYQMLLKFNSGMLGHVTVDVVSRPAFRVFRVMGSEGSVEWDHGANQLKVWSGTGRPNNYHMELIPLVTSQIEPGYIHGEQPYVDEMADFVAAVRREKPWPFTYETDGAVLDLLIRAETASDTGTTA